jgi:ribosomal protein L14
MVGLKSKVVAVDNSSVLRLRCIGLNNSVWGRVGSFFLGVVRLFRTGGAWKLGQKVALLLVRRKKLVSFYSGILFKFRENGVILIQKIGITHIAPLITRLKGPLPYKLRMLGLSKLFMLGARAL